MDKPSALKALQWWGSSKRDLLSLPAPVVDFFGFALYLAQDGRKHEQTKPLSGLRFRRRAGIEPSTPCGSRVRYTQSRYGSDPRASQSSGADRQGVIAMKKQRVVRSEEHTSELQSLRHL